MNWLTLAIVVILVISAIGGFASGLIKSVFGFIGLIVGVVLAGRYYAALSEHLPFISSQSAARVAAFIIIFLVIIIIAAIVAAILTKFVSAIFLGWVNRLLGAAFGVLIGAVFIAAILAIWVRFMGPSDTIINSSLAQFLVDRFPLVLALLPKEFDSVRGFFQGS